MKKHVWMCVLLSVCALLCACMDTKPAETTTAVITTAVPVETTTAETTAAITMTEPVETTITPIETTAATTAPAPAETTVAVTSAAPVAEEPGVEYTVLYDADGHETGVLFTYPDGVHISGIAPSSLRCRCLCASKRKRANGKPVL